MQPAGKIYVVGIGYKPLGKEAGEIVRSADSIIASRRLLEVFHGYEEFAQAEGKIRVIGTVDETIEYIRANHRQERIVLLASGDPMFFGIGRRVAGEFGKEAVEILPDLSSVQVAFSKIKATWDDAFLMSLHGGPDPQKRRRLPYEMRDIPALLQRHHKIAVLTDRENSPTAIAKEIAQSSVFSLHPSALTLHVCERLGYPDEKVTEGSPGEIAAQSFSDPNVVIIERNSFHSSGRSSGPVFGLTESEIEHSRGLITKDEIRAAALHKLRLPQSGVLWDIGAGSGSLSIEAARLSPGIRVFAVEKEEEQAGNIRRNRDRYGLPNIEFVEGPAPGSLEGLPSPDRVFIGGSSGQLEGIIEHVRGLMPSGIIVINASTIDTLHDALLRIEKAGFLTEVSQISVSRSKVIGGKAHMSALNPVFIITGRKD